MASDICLSTLGRLYREGAKQKKLEHRLTDRILRPGKLKEKESNIQKLNELIMLYAVAKLTIFFANELKVGDKFKYNLSPLGDNDIQSIRYKANNEYDKALKTLKSSKSGKDTDMGLFVDGFLRVIVDYMTKPNGEGKVYRDLTDSDKDEIQAAFGLFVQKKMEEATKESE